MTRYLFLLFILTLSLHSPAQSDGGRIEGISEPPELTGTPKQLKVPSEADKAILEIVGHLKDPVETKAALPKLDDFLKRYPEYSDAYFLRAMSNACILQSRDFESVRADVKAAMSYASRNIYNETDYYSLLGKISLASGQYTQAVDYLEKAMMRDLDMADRMFNIEGVKPERTSKFCTWNLGDLEDLVHRFPKDSRSYIFRGLYYQFFATFNEDYYQRASREFQAAAGLNPKSPVPQYLMGQLYSKASFWTKKAWESDQGRDAAVQHSVEFYTKAIALDPGFLPAYEQRASGYLNLKHYPQALADYDKILERSPDNTTAHSDRGIARLESGRYFAAISDFDDAIRLKNDDDSFLPELHEYRGDAHVKLGLYRDAISDYSKSIERRLSSEIFLLSLQQIRALYPEYDGVSDEVLLRKINVLFWPQFDFKTFVDHMKENGKWQVSLLNELFEKRGDAYLKIGDFRRGVFDFKRIFNGIPNFADSTDRWRPLGRSGAKEEYFIDVKSADFSNTSSPRLWIKIVNDQGYQTIAYSVDCKSRQLSETSTITYDTHGKLLRSSENGNDYSQIVPDSIGEQLYNGACSR